MAKYRVVLKAFNSGEHYVKTETDSYPAAVSVAKNSSYGREYSVIDNETGEIKVHGNEEADMKEFMTSKEGYDTTHPYG